MTHTVWDRTLDRSMYRSAAPDAASKTKRTAIISPSTPPIVSVDLELKLELKVLGLLP